MKRLFKGARKPALGLNSSGGRTETAGSSAALAVSSATVTSRREWIEHSIAFSCGTGSDDWEGFLAIGEECERNAESAKTTMKALRQEFQLGVPSAQAQAARLTVILWHNSGVFFKQQLASKKFLQAYEAALKRADPELHALMLKALMVLSYESQTSKDLYPLTQLYNKHKSPQDPVNGEPLPEDDTTFEPAGNPQQHVRPHHTSQSDGPRDLWSEAEKAKSRAKVLSETLSFTATDALDNNELINEFYAACQKSQHIIVERIPWASQQAEEAAAKNRTEQQTNPEQTNEEKLLAALMEANEELTSAFSMYDDAHRRKRAAEEERIVQERSVAEQRMSSADHQQQQVAYQGSQPQPQTALQQPQQNDPYSSLFSAPFAANNAAFAPSSPASSSRNMTSPPPAIFSAPPISHESHSDHADPFSNPAPSSSVTEPVLGPYRTESPDSFQRSGSPALASSTSNPFIHSQQQSQHSSRGASPEPQQAATVTRRGSRLSSNNPFASVISREQQQQLQQQQQQQQRSASPQFSEQQRSESPAHSLSKLQLGSQPLTPNRSFSPIRAGFPEDSPTTTSPDRTLSASIPEEVPGTGLSERAQEPDRNPFHQQLAASTSSSMPPPSPSSLTTGRARKPSQAESIIQTPTEPSAKAMGKLRRYSEMYGSDVDEANRAEQLYRQNEEKLRERYASASRAGGAQQPNQDGGSAL